MLTINQVVFAVPVADNYRFHQQVVPLPDKRVHLSLVNNPLVRQAGNQSAGVQVADDGALNRRRGLSR